jgi:hypothetical protein
LEEGFQTSGEDIIKAALPGWVNRSTVAAKLYPVNGRPQWKVGFRCDCRTAKWSVFVKTVDKTIQQVAQSARARSLQIAAGHDKCNGMTASAAAPLSKREALLQAEVISGAKRQKTLERKIAATKPDKGAAVKLAAAATTQNLYTSILNAFKWRTEGRQDNRGQGQARGQDNVRTRPNTVPCNKTQS